MITIKKKYVHFNILFFLIFIAVFFSSMLGAQLFGISLNKIGLIPLEIYVIYHILINGKISVNKNLYPLLIFYLVQVIGSLFGLMKVSYNDTYSGYNERLINNIIQNILIYLPIVTGIGLIKDKYPIFDYLKKSIIYVARFQCVWAIIQFLLWVTVRFDLNDYIFIDIFNGGLGDSFNTTLIFLNGKTSLRAIGLNHEPAALATLMLLGVCFDRKILFKVVYFFACVLAMSRTGIIAILVTLFIQIIYHFYHKKQYARVKLFYRLFFGAIFLTILFFILYNKIETIKLQVDNVLDRFFNMGENSDGSERHIMYPIYAWYSWLMDLNIFEKIWGVGARVSGLTFVHSEYVSSHMIFNNEMLTTAWEIECDMGAILLGDGIVGFFAYLYILFRLIKTKNIELLSLGTGLFVYGFMYATFSNTLIQITLIIILATLKKVEKKVEMINCFK